MRVEEAEVPAAHPADQPGAAEQADRLAVGREAHAAAVEQEVDFAGLHFEGAGALHEEGPSLGKEQREPGEVDPLVIHLGLGGIGVGVRSSVRLGERRGLEVAARLEPIVAMPGESTGSGARIPSEPAITYGIRRGSGRRDVLDAHPLPARRLPRASGAEARSPESDPSLECAVSR